MTTESADRAANAPEPAGKTEKRADKEGVRALLRWTVVAVLASWALNLLTFWVALEQHRDANELLHVQAGVALDEEFNSGEMLRARTILAMAVHYDKWPDDFRVMQFFDKVGLFMEQGRLDTATVYQQFGRPVKYYWPATQKIVAGMRESSGDETLFTHFEQLFQLVSKEEAKRRSGHAPPPLTEDQQIRNFIDEERRLDPSVK
jgi:hypothetical protein